MTNSVHADQSKPGYASLRPLLLIAVLFTVLNAFKPLCIDDAFYHYHAEQIAQHPFDPYGFRVFQNDRPEPAVQALAPVLFQYWWAIAIRIFGPHPFWWKIWLLPFALLLVCSVHSLLRRFAGRNELILTAMVIFSPVFLPSFNLMLDVPAAALVLFAIVIFLRAAERNSLALAATAGLVAGIAAQTKYNGLVAPAVMLYHALLCKRYRLGIVAAIVAGAFFLGWETFIYLTAGRSHFLAQSETYGSVNLVAKYAYLAWPIVTIMGAVAPFLTLLAIIAFTPRKQIAVFGAVVIVTGFLLLAFAPAGVQNWGPKQSNSLAFIIFSIFGITFFAALIAVIKQLIHSELKPQNYWQNWSAHQTEWFLTGWWLFEIVAYFALSPIPAVRRVLLLLVVTTLIIGRLIGRLPVIFQGLIRWTATASVLLGLLFYAVDFRDAYVEQAAIEQSRQAIATMAGPATTWYLGRWGLQFYGEQAGMKPVLPDESVLQAGDFLVTTDSVYAPEPVMAHLRRYQLEPVTEFSLGDRLPLSTMLGYYNSGIPIHHQAGPRRRVKIYRVVGAANATG